MAQQFGSRCVVDADSVLAESAASAFGGAHEYNSSCCLCGGKIGQRIGDELGLFDGFSQFAQGFDLTNSDAMIGDLESGGGGSKTGRGQQIIWNVRGGEQGVGEAPLSGRGDDDPRS